MYTCTLYCTEHILVSASMLTSHHELHVKYAILLFCFSHPHVSLTFHINFIEQLMHWVYLTYAFLLPLKHYRIRICIWWEIRKCRQSWSGMCGSCKARIQLRREGTQCTEVTWSLTLLSFFSLFSFSLFFISLSLNSFPLTSSLSLSAISHHSL